MRVKGQETRKLRKGKKEVDRKRARERKWKQKVEKNKSTNLKQRGASDFSECSDCAPGSRAAQRHEARGET